MFPLIFYFFIFTTAASVKKRLNKIVTKMFIELLNKELNNICRVPLILQKEKKNYCNKCQTDAFG